MHTPRDSSMDVVDIFPTALNRHTSYNDRLYNDIEFDKKCLHISGQNGTKATIFVVFAPLRQILEKLGSAIRPSACYRYLYGACFLAFDTTAVCARTTFLLVWGGVDMTWHT